MIEYKCKVRVRYSETDQMGYVYYGNYAAYYEVARVEMLRNLGTTYKEMEESGIMMPVLELKCKYIKPAFYDEELTITVKILEKPQTRIIFHYEIYNEKEELINIGETTLVFIDIKKNRPGLPSKEFEQRLAPYFNN
jgi:acyl-CoA thioester hydrolase